MSAYPLILLAAVAAAGSVSLATPASAQESRCIPPAKPKKGLGGLLSEARGAGLLGSVMSAARRDGDIGAGIASTGRNAASRAADKAIACAEQSAPEAAQPSRGERRSNAGQPTVMNQSGSVHPVRRSRPAEDAYRYPSELPKPAGFAEQERAYQEFGKSKCFGCEGGYSYDGWPEFPRDEHSGSYGGNSQRVGSWPVGFVHRWKGNVANGSLTVVSEEMVGGFKCRRMLYRLEKGSASAERPGLYCLGRANQFAGSETWQQVY